VVDTPFAFPPVQATSIAVTGEATLRFAIRRVYCVAQNYTAHAREMNTDPQRELPAFFTKPADAVVSATGTLPFPLATRELHHEVELVLALGDGGSNLDPERARAAVWGYCVGLDLTRRDLQRSAKDARGPWDVSKAFDASAPVTPIRRRSSVGEVCAGRIWLAVNGVLRQEADLSDMIWSPAEIVANLSRYFCLVAGDLVFTGTPAGVGPLVPGDVINAGIAGIDELELRVGDSGSGDRFP
jgi:fumarylpyruvate hydrolase